MYALPLLSLIGYFLGLRRVSKWSIEAIPFFVISLLISLLYIAGVLNFLPYVAKALVVIGLVLLFFSPWYVNKDEWLSKYFTPGLLFIVLFAIFFGCFAVHSHFHTWHEFVQWGARAKILAITGKLFTRSPALEHYEYPPGTALYYYWFYVFSGYSEGVAHLAQQFLFILGLGIFAKNYNWESWQRAFLVVSFAVFALIIMHVPMASNVTLHVHYTIGILFGLMLACYYSSEKRIIDILYLFPIAFFFISIKPDMLGFLAFLCVILLIDQLARQSGQLFLRFLMIVLLFMVGLASHWIWYWFLHSNGVGPISTMTTWPTWPLTSQEVVLLHQFLRVFLWHLPGFVALMLLIIANVLLAEEKKARGEVLFFHSLMLVGFVFYVLILLAIYLYGSGASGAFYFSSLSNFFQIYYIAWALLMYASFLPEWRESYFGKQRYLIGSMIAVALIAFPTYLFYGHYRHLKEDHQQFSLLHLRRALRPLIAAAKSIIPRKASVYVIWQNSTGFERAVIAYSLLPRAVNSQPSSFGMPYSASDEWTMNYSPKYLAQLIASFDYTMLAYTDAQFWNKYSQIFPNRSQYVLVQYLICKKDGFNGFGLPGCRMQATSAYLYKTRKTKA